MKHFFFVRIFVLIFLVFILGSQITCVVLFTESKLKSDRNGTIIWYQSLGGSFQFRFSRFLTGKSVGDVKSRSVALLAVGF
ncbi:hypothetical protein HanIR_Chr11g0516861 [Helianthus annuus]|nr:hypothetical protein HanIR_Chr11g0516861 [Helianthus annuus]